MHSRDKENNQRHNKLNSNINGQDVDFQVNTPVPATNISLRSKRTRKVRVEQDEVKRTKGNDGNKCSPTRPSHSSDKSAKPKVMATPSPGRASAAIAMLQFTSGATKKKLPDSAGSISSCSMLNGPSTLGDMFQILSGYLGNRRVEIEESRFAQEIGIDSSRVKELFAVLQAVKVMHGNTWVGIGNLSTTVENILLKNEQIEVTKPLHDLELPILMKLVLQYSLATFAANPKPNDKPKWTLGQLSAKLPQVKRTPPNQQCVLQSKLHDVVSLLVSFGLIKVEKSALSLDDTEYVWNGIPGIISESLQSPDPASMLSKCKNGMPPPSAVKYNVTPADLINKATATPKSVQDGRRNIRKEMRNQVYLSLKRNIEGAFRDSPLFPSFQSGNAIKFSDQAKTPLLSQKLTQGFGSHRSNIFTALGKPNHRTNANTTTNNVKHKELPSKDSGLQAKKFSSFTFSNLGIIPNSNSMERIHTRPILNLDETKQKRHGEIAEPNVEGTNKRESIESVSSISSKQEFKHSPFVPYIPTIQQQKVEDTVPKSTVSALSYFNHPLPAPNTEAFEPENATTVSSSVLAASSMSDFSESKYLVPLAQTGCTFKKLPLPSEMLAYQTRCLKEFMKHYLIHFKRHDPNWVQHELDACRERTNVELDDEHLFSSQESKGSLSSTHFLSGLQFNDEPMTQQSKKPIKIEPQTIQQQNKKPAPSPFTLYTTLFNDDI